jgi:hypothetical protein
MTVFYAEIWYRARKVYQAFKGDTRGQTFDGDAMFYPLLALVLFSLLLIILDQLQAILAPALL